MPHLLNGTTPMYVHLLGQGNDLLVSSTTGSKQLTISSDSLHLFILCSRLQITLSARYTLELALQALMLNKDHHNSMDIGI